MTRHPWSPLPEGVLAVSDLLASASGIGYAAADDDQIDRLLAIVRHGVTATAQAGLTGRAPDH